MVDVLDIDSYSAFQAAVAKYPGQLFRGQTTDYPEVTPSLFRRNPIPDLAPLMEPTRALYFAAHRVDEIANEVRDSEMRSASAQWVEDTREEDAELGWFDRLVRRLFKIDPILSSEPDDDDGTWNYYRPMTVVGHGFGSPSQYDEHCGLQWIYSSPGHYHHGLLQHYGAPTPTLDIAYEGDVPLWFATNKFIWDRTTQKVWYEPSTGIGVVYVMAASKDQLIDLREGKAVPIAGLRGQRQNGGLLIGATEASPRLTSHVIAKFRIHPGTFDPAEPRLKRLTQSHLFPPPSEDVFYRTLLEAKQSTDAGISHVASYIADYRYH